MNLLPMRLARRLFLALCAAALLQASLTSEEQFLASAITANELKAHVSFLASDTLEGRDTPSKGLDVAAEYIASEFRRAGLEPAGDDGYFQSAPYEAVTENLAGFRFSIEKGGKTIDVPASMVRVNTESAVDLKDVPVLKLPLGVDVDDSWMAPSILDGKAVITVRPDFHAMTEAQRNEHLQRMMRVRRKLRESKAAVLIEATRNLGSSGARLTDRSGQRQAPPPSIAIYNQAFGKLAEHLLAGEVQATVSLHAAGSDVNKVTLRNVAGLLRGSDPKLKNTYVIVSGHYDHVGIEGGQIYNGANDDASGTSCMLALAEALARMPDRPKRSILFLAYFGEEKGLLGSRYYGAHPLFPLAQTDANFNLEQMGRTDDSEGAKVKRVSVTGFDYSNMTDWLVDAGRYTGIKFYKHETNSDSYFGRSDNQSLADSGVPAHTLVVAFMYPDYHQPGDHWEKLDYDNMAEVTRAVGVAVVRLANSPKPVEWNTGNPRTEGYVKAAKALAAAQ